MYKMKSKFLLSCILISSLTSCGQRNDQENIVETDPASQIENNEDKRTPEEKARIAAQAEELKNKE